MTERPITLCQLKQKVCSLTYGSSPCTAAVGVTGAQKCFNTRTTCQDPANFDETTKTLTLSEPIEGVPLEWNTIPSLKRVSVRPNKINFAGLTKSMSPLGARAAATIDVQDHPDGDSLTDPYVSERTYDPETRGTFWGKWIARNQDWQDFEVDIVTTELYPDTTVYWDDFTADTSGEWIRGQESVDGTITVAGGKLVYTKGAGDGLRPRIIRKLFVEPNKPYRVTIPAATGTSPRRELWVTTSPSGGFFQAVTPIVNNAALETVFQTSASIVYVVIRAGTDSTTGDTVEVDNVLIERIAMETVKSFFLEEVNGPDANGSVSLTVRDILSRTDGGSAKVPRATSGALNAGINASADTLVVALAPGEAWQEYKQRNASFGLLKIGKEILQFNVFLEDTPSAGFITFGGVERGQFGTIAESHSAGDSVQYGPLFVDMKPFRIIKELLEDWAGVPTSWIPESDWSDEHDRWLLPYNQITGGIIEPIDVDEAIGEILESVMASMWVDTVNREIKFRAARPAEEDIIALNDQNDILAGSMSRQVKMAEQVSRADVYFGVINLNEKVDETKNYLNRRTRFGEQLGLPRTRQILSRWLKTDVQATETARTLMQASNSLPIYVTLSVGANRVGHINPGDVVRLHTRIVQDVTGLNLSSLYLVIEVNENGGESATLTLRSIGGFPATSEWAPSDAPDFDDATDEEKEQYAFWADEDGNLDGQPSPYSWA